VNTFEDLPVSDMPIGFPTSFWQIKEMTMLYSCAMREICTKLENLSQEFELNKSRNRYYSQSNYNIKLIVIASLKPSVYLRFEAFFNLLDWYF